MKNIALRLRYDGSRYHGWQVQKNAITVAQTMEEALAKVCGERVKLTGCGRTDAGVHALRYCANFHSDCTVPVDRMPLAVNSRLPDDIAVVDAVEVPDDFNAIGSCVKKEYVYKILNSRIPDPFLADRVCFYPQRLDISLMQAAARAFEGTHDFKAVRSEGTQRKNDRAHGVLVPRREGRRPDNRFDMRKRLLVQHVPRHGRHDGLRVLRQAHSGGDTGAA